VWFQIGFCATHDECISKQRCTFRVQVRVQVRAQATCRLFASVYRLRRCPDISTASLATTLEKRSRGPACFSVCCRQLGDDAPPSRQHPQLRGDSSNNHIHNHIHNHHTAKRRPPQHPPLARSAVPHEESPQPSHTDYTEARTRRAPTPGHGIFIVCYAAALVCRHPRPPPIFSSSQSLTCKQRMHSPQHDCSHRTYRFGLIQRLLTRFSRPPHTRAQAAFAPHNRPKQAFHTLPDQIAGRLPCRPGQRRWPDVPGHCRARARTAHPFWLPNKSREEVFCRV
jgi:hypothetical protein